MQTITFYSYKGGVGRTLAVANVAKYLARFGQKVFLVDFDLEAPGLHYKLALGEKDHQKKIELGVLDYIYSFAIEGKIPDSLEPYVIPVDLSSSFKGSINLMPAGKIPCTDYWRRLARINWHELFYSDQAEGIPFFLEFKERIERDYAPDFLLVDSRTGVTEIGGVATSLWPDRLVCLLLNNRENLEGARAVLRSIQSLKRLPGQGSIEILPVLTRIPKIDESALEERIVKDIQEFLNEEAEELTQTLNVQEVFILHSEPELQIKESLTIGGGKSPDESFLLRDYLRLCARLIPKVLVEPYIDPLIKETIARALEDPDSAQLNLETLADTYAYTEVYRTLLQFYRLRRADKDIQLRAAWLYWNLNRENKDPLIWETVKNNIESFPDYATRKPKVPLEFIEATWRAAGSNHVETALYLAKFYAPQGDYKATKILLEMLDDRKPDSRVVVQAIRLLNRSGKFEEAINLVSKYKSTFCNNEEFQVAWANLIVKQENTETAVKLVEEKDFSIDLVRNNDLKTWANLMILTGHSEEIEETLQRELSRELIKGRPNRKIEDIGELYHKLGKIDEFADKVKGSLGDEAELLLRHLSIRLPPGRFS